MELYIALQHYTLQNRENSPCRDEYPESLKTMLANPMPESLFYNPLNAPNLPYDPNTCGNLCDAKYYLPKCGCYINVESWIYAGKPENATVCPFVTKNQTCNQNLRAPPTEISKCECYQKCTSYKFRLVAADKIKYSLGNIPICMTVQ